MTDSASTGATRLSSPERRGADWVVAGGLAIAALAGVTSLVGLLSGGGPGLHEVETARGATTILYGRGLYAADTWLVGAGSRGQDFAMIAVEIPALLMALRWYRGRSAAAGVALGGVLAFFAYYFTSLTFATAQNRLFPLYVLLFGLSIASLIRVAATVDFDRFARQAPTHPTRGSMLAYLVAVATALTVAWLPELLAPSVTGEIAAATGPYTSNATVALDLGLVVPAVGFAAYLLVRRRPAGYALTAGLLVLNVLIGILLVSQGVAQLADGVPLTTGEVVGKMLSFAVLTLLAGGMLLRGVAAARRQPGRREVERSMF